MVIGTRQRIAAALMVGILAVLGSVQAHAAAPVVGRYACDSGQTLIVSRTNEKASVRFIDRTYDLARRPSSIGQKYSSNTAALIIDGLSAVSLADDRRQLGRCVQSKQMASVID